MRKDYNNKKAFTLIETLVAISILMIAIAGPLTIASKGYTAAIDARNQSIATNLAQEGLEKINNDKDNRIGNWAGWEPVKWRTPAVNISLSCSSANPCSYPTNVVGFTRNYYLTQSSNSYNQILATVVVSWHTGLVSNHVQVQQVLSNDIR